MEVFLIPLGPARYEPYCEVEDAGVHEAGAPPAPGVFRGMWARFQQMLKDAERAQRDRDMADGARSLGGRLSDRLMAWVAEKIAEQRLLWHLRKQDTATLVHPADVDAPAAESLLREQLQRDADRHFRWAIIDTVLTLITGPLLFFVPGPNLVAYYFAFRAVGHYLSYRGAKQGLACVTWSYRASEALAELRRVAALDPPQRDDTLRAVAAQLELPDLPSFFDRMVLPSA